MSWMDSWSRPSKQSAIPPPLYLTSDNVKYCSTCGRVIGARRSHQKNKVVKYCSDGCRNHRPGPLDRKIDKTILALLLDEKDSGLETTDAKNRMKKGDKRLIITCNEIERIVFKRDDPPSEDQVDGADAGADADAEVDEDSDDDGGVAADDAAPHVSDHVEVSADEAGGLSEHEGTKRISEEGPSLEDRRQEGQRRADEREKVRRAARRAVVFGFPRDPTDQPQNRTKGKRSNSNEEAADEVPNRKCEALVNGRLVEPSFAKGNWAIRWRE